MHLAIFAPISFLTTSRSLLQRERTISLLTKGLTGRGIEVSIFNIPISEDLHAVSLKGCRQPDPSINPDLWESLYCAEFFDRADDFDLIHIHADVYSYSDVIPLTYTGSIKTPVIMTLYGLPPLDVLPIYKKYNGKVFYVLTSDAERSPELTYIAAIPPVTNIDPDSFQAEPMVENYIQVYEQILGLRKREDHRPWGYYIILSDEERYKSKKIVVYPGKRLSLQYHRRRKEHWFIVQGKGKITLNDQDSILSESQSIDIPRGALHRIENIGKDDLWFIEVQTGDYFGEDDIVRIEDDFGRERGNEFK